MKTFTIQMIQNKIVKHEITIKAMNKENALKSGAKKAPTDEAYAIKITEVL